MLISRFACSTRVAPTSCCLCPTGIADSLAAASRRACWYDRLGYGWSDDSFKPGIKVRSSQVESGSLPWHLLQQRDSSSSGCGAAAAVTATALVQLQQHQLSFLEPSRCSTPLTLCMQSTEALHNLLAAVPDMALPPTSSRATALAANLPSIMQPRTLQKWLALRSWTGGGREAVLRAVRLPCGQGKHVHLSCCVTHSMHGVCVAAP